MRNTVLIDVKRLDDLEWGYRLLEMVGELSTRNPDMRAIDAWHEARELMLQEDITNEFKEDK
jgi:hypothetical protein